MPRIQEFRLVLAIAALAVAVLVLGVSVGRALVPSEPVTPAAPASGSADGTAAAVAVVTSTLGPLADVLAGRPEPSAYQRASASLEALDMAADQDPFQPTRRRAPAYRIGGFQEPEEAREEERPEPPPFNVVGVAVTPNGGLAMIQVDAGAATPVAVGESLQGYRLVAVNSERVVMQGQGQVLNLEVSPPEQPRRRGGRNDNDREREARGGQAQQRGNAVVRLPDGTTIQMPTGPGAQNAQQLRELLQLEAVRGALIQGNQVQFRLNQANEPIPIQPAPIVTQDGTVIFRRGAIEPEQQAQPQTVRPGRVGNRGG